MIHPWKKSSLMGPHSRIHHYENVLSPCAQWWNLSLFVKLTPPDEKPPLPLSPWTLYTILIWLWFSSNAHTYVNLHFVWHIFLNSKPPIWEPDFFQSLCAHPARSIPFFGITFFFHFFRQNFLLCSLPCLKKQGFFPIFLAMTTKILNKNKLYNW